MSTESSNRIKNAASMLLKGGTLVSEQCPKCGGVQVRLKGKTTCVNCGEVKQEEKQEQKSTNTDSVAVIERKVNALASELASEQDLAIQKQKADLLETYLRILERMKGLNLK
jgi:uncharacterized Zn finger protein (UPF0148 family)